MRYIKSVQSVVVQLEGAPVTIDGTPWQAVEFACEVTCETGECPDSGPWAETEARVNTFVLEVEREGEHGVLEQARVYHGEAAANLISNRTLWLAEWLAMEEHGS